MYEKLKTTTDREAKKKLRLEYETRMQHLHDDQNHHGTLSEDELAEVYVRTTICIARARARVCVCATNKVSHNFTIFSLIYLGTARGIAG